MNARAPKTRIPRANPPEKPGSRQRLVRQQKWEIDLYSGEYDYTFTLTCSGKPKIIEPHKIKFGDAEIGFDYMDICGIKAVRRK